MDLYWFWIIVFVIPFNFGSSDPSVNETKKTEVKTSDELITVSYNTTTKLPTETSGETNTQTATSPKLWTHKSKYTKGADVIFVLCIVISCGLMLVLLTLLSFVALHYYKGKQQSRDDLRYLDQTFTSTTNLTDHSFTNGTIELKTVENGESSCAFIDTSTLKRNGCHSNGDTASHFKDLIGARCGVNSSRNHHQDIQYPSLVHPSEIGLGRKKLRRPRRRSNRRKKHLIPIPESTVEAAAVDGAMEMRDFTNEFKLIANITGGEIKEGSTSVVFNPLASAGQLNAAAELKRESAFETHVPHELTENFQNNQLNEADETYGDGSKSFSSQHPNQATHSRDKNMQYRNISRRKQRNRPVTSDNVVHAMVETSCWDFRNINMNNDESYHETLDDAQDDIEDILVEPPEKYKDNYSDNAVFENEGKAASQNIAANHPFVTETTPNHVTNLHVIGHNCSTRFNVPEKVDQSRPKKDLGNSSSGNHSLNVAISSHHGHYNKYHPGYATVDHIKRKNKKKHKGIHKKISHSCPNSPILGNRTEYSDVPAVTYIRTYPSVYVTVETNDSLSNSIDGDFDVSKYIDTEWEMRTMF